MAEKDQTPDAHPHVVVENGIVVAEREGDAIVPWWSVGKTVLAAAALALVRDGKLALDEPVAGKAFTLRQLLQHRAGLSNYGPLPEYKAAVARGDEPWTDEEMLARSDAQRLRYPPGEGWDYSNIGYWTVCRLIEQAAGTSLGAALRALVFAPLGLGNARLAETKADLNDVRMGAAAGYHPRWVYHGLVVGPLTEAALFMDRLLTGELLPPDLLNEMRTPHPLGGPLEGRPWKTTGYGLGLMIGTFENDLPVMGHTGGGPGSTIAVYQARGSGVTRTAAVFVLGREEGVEEALVQVFL